MPTLYLTEQGSVLRKSGRRYLVELRDEIIADIPMIKIDRIFIFGHIQISTQALELSFDNGIPMAFFTINGKLKGIVEPQKSRNVLLRMKQCEAMKEKKLRIDMARSVIYSKILSEINIIKSYHRNHATVNFSEELSELSAICASLSNKNSVKSIRGLEGIASHFYFQAFRRMINNKDFPFIKRTKRPPRDEINSILSYGYTILTTEYTYGLLAHGFDPYMGFLHEIYYGRPSLSLDLVEETRHEFIDRIVLTLVNRHQISRDGFVKSGQGYLMKQEAKRCFFSAYEKLMTGGKRRIITKQILNMEKAMMENTEYRGLNG